MKKWLVPISVLALALMVASTCTNEASTPTATVAPTATASLISTPLPVKELEIEDVQVNDSTVTVSLRVYAGISAQATLDGKPSDVVTETLLTLEYVFLNVAPGQHTVEV